MLPPFPDLGHIKKMETRRYPLKSWQNPSEEPLRCSLVFPLDIKGRRVLLGRKKRGFGIGLWNGFGGKLDQGETMDQCVIRELYEECGLIPNSGGLYEVGRMMILRPSSSTRASCSSSDLSSLNPSNPLSPTSSSPLKPSDDSQTGFTRETKHRRNLVNAQTIDISIYICSSWSGEITESEEMFPQWFELSNSGSSGLPLDLMMDEKRRLRRL
ncbi:hypothetical protein TREMEDRAFT_59989 [Tremella mesenterica DSM 1558]|uniref:uncharacterized protein n=1 Tax=Tremella mesenterica (strain ATCC 24925 / CBS 8224 / DSM 1558 / NBRC 9311 / NRRL Y-6157 / RJB 2259-6 / UBC 559-6) TaxID=578456 RepID=UPI0003F4A2CD|nr:uncharacterized protein TREMEDRAFT_59989 [Tremella mesenterica DSM 1558]EIW71045.1 hypothetical protein TREMEDRAFT_59989 [Tremella mesenterica DSM 1558]